MSIHRFFLVGINWIVLLTVPIKIVSYIPSSNVVRPIYTNRFEIKHGMICPHGIRDNKYSATFSNIRPRSVKEPHSISTLQLGLGGGFNFEDLVYNAQSTASDLATYSISGAAESGTSSPISLLILYLAGLLTSFSPCSLGLLPLTVSYISAAAGEREDKAALFPTVAFAAGLAFVFSGLGLSVSLLGGVFGQTVSSSDNLIAALSLVALSSGVSIAMGLQLLEIINIPLPSIEVNLPFLTNEEVTSSSSLYSTETLDDDGNIPLYFDDEGIIQLPSDPAEATLSASSSIAKNSVALFRVFLLGGSCALLESPCATPVLAAILAFVGVSQNPVLGATLLLTYTVGYATPLLIVGATGGEALARLQASSSNIDDMALNDTGPLGVIPKIGQFVSPFTGGILIWYGTNAFLTGVFGDASISGLSPVL